MITRRALPLNSMYLAAFEVYQHLSTLRHHLITLLQRITFRKVSLAILQRCMVGLPCIMLPRSSQENMKKSKSLGLPVGL